MTVVDGFPSEPVTADLTLLKELERKSFHLLILLLPAVMILAEGVTKTGTTAAAFLNIDGKPYYMVDVAIAAEHLVLEAVEQGLGTVWVGAFKEDRVQKALGIPQNIKVVALIPIGYPAGKEGVRAKLLKAAVGSANRKDLKEIVHFQKW